MRAVYRFVYSAKDTVVLVRGLLALEARETLLHGFELLHRRPVLRPDLLAAPASFAVRVNIHQRSLLPEVFVLDLQPVDLVRFDLDLVRFGLDISHQLHDVLFDGCTGQLDF